MGKAGASDVVQDLLQEQINKAYEDSVKKTIDDVNKTHFTDQLKASIYEQNIKRLPELIALLNKGELKDIP